MSKLRLVLMLMMTAAAIVTLPNVSTAQPNASGGGCQDAGNNGMDSCVAAYGESMPLTLIGNFALYNYSTTIYDGAAYYYMCFAGGGCNFHFTDDTNYLGSHPLMFDQTGMGAGSARAEFEMFENITFHWYDRRVSPWQDWIP